MSYLPKKELCAGHKIYRRIDGYKYYKRASTPRKNRRCPLCPKFKRVRLAKRFQEKEVKYGQTDSCTGDSGGPLWKWIGKKKPRARVIHLFSKSIS